jgi:hypothetical protein
MNSPLAVITILAALALLGVVEDVKIVTIPLQQQQAEAARCNNGVAFNASKGRCLGH